MEDNQNIIDSGMCWNENYITLDDIRSGIANRIEEQTEQYKPHYYKHETFKSDEWHIGRVIYFVNNPDMITPIDITADIYSNRYKCIQKTNVSIDDGHHRLIAHLILGNKIIKAYYSGRCDLLDYLTGQTDKKPIEWV